jgi:hypothetical protein
VPSELAKTSLSTVAAPTARPIVPAIIADAGQKAGNKGDFPLGRRLTTRNMHASN